MLECTLFINALYHRITYFYLLLLSRYVRTLAPSISPEPVRPLSEPNITNSVRKGAGYLQNATEDTAKSTLEEALDRSKETIGDALNLSENRVDLRNDGARGRDSGSDEGDERAGDGGDSRDGPLQFRLDLVDL